MRGRLRWLGCAAVAVCWALAVVVCPDVAAFAADDPTPAGTPTMTATEAPPAPVSPGATVDAEPTAPLVSETAAVCGTLEEPCVVQLADEQWSLLDEARATGVAGLAVLVLCALASLVGSWGRRG